MLAQQEAFLPSRSSSPVGLTDEALTKIIRSAMASRLAVGSPAGATEREFDR
jgi:hypothetical protein